MAGLKERIAQASGLFGDPLVTVGLTVRSLAQEGDPGLTPRPGTGVRDVVFTTTHLTNWAIAVGARSATNAVQNVRLLGGLPRSMLQHVGLSDAEWRALEAKRRKVRPTDGWRIGAITLEPTAHATIVSFMNALMGPDREKLLRVAPLFGVRFETWGRGPEDFCRATIRFPGPSSQALECSYAWPSQQQLFPDSAGQQTVFSSPEAATRARTAIARSFDLSGELLSSLTDLLLEDEAKRARKDFSGHRRPKSQRGTESESPEARPGTAKTSGRSSDQISIGTKREPHTSAAGRDVGHPDSIRMCACAQPPSPADLVVSPTLITGDDNGRRHAAHPR